MITADTPEQVVAILDEAFMRGDLDTIAGFYDDAAVVVPTPGVEARGVEQIRAFYQRMLQPGITVRQDVTRVLEADGVALFLSRWTAESKSEPTQQFTSTVVLRRHPDTGWKVLIDNARGPALLDNA